MSNFSREKYIDITLNKQIVKEKFLKVYWLYSWRKPYMLVKIRNTCVKSFLFLFFMKHDFLVYCFSERCVRFHITSIANTHFVRNDWPFLCFSAYILNRNTFTALELKGGEISKELGKGMCKYVLIPYFTQGCSVVEFWTVNL